MPVDLKRDSLFAVTLARRLDAADDGLTLPLHPNSTIAPDRSRPDEPGRGAIVMLQRAGHAGDGLEMRETLGEGGMGVVRAARQLRLGRDVAVKSLRADLTDELSTLNLLREAWVTGMLEHPNVVPIHDVSIDADGRPRIVLKRIDGSRWSDLLGRDEEVRRRFGARDVFEWHARVLLQVANAAQFAHSRGILHRDIKPDNVMIGAFGEVYLLDWGIAVSLIDDGSGRLPLARDAVELAGTPVYMAPEMVGGEAGRLSARTDVYLLGAVLFEVVAGKPPHDGANLRELIAHILASPPALPATCSTELARIVHTAMALEPADRFDDVEAFRGALTAYLEHRGSLSLAADAAARAAELQEALRAREDGPPEDLRVALYRTFAEARFGFLEALRAWPENEAARKGLREAVQTMVRFELDGGDPRAASVLLAELPAPDPSLRARVEAARAEHARTERRRARLEADLDPRTGHRTRLLLGSILGLLWTAAPLTTWVLEREGIRRRTLDDAVASSVLMILIGAGLAFWARDSLGKTAVNRTLRNGTAICVFGQLALYLGGRALGLEMNVVESIKLLFFATITAHIAFSVDRVFWWPTAAYLTGFGLGARWPAVAHLVEACGSVVVTATVLAVSRAMAPAAPRPGSSGTPSSSRGSSARGRWW